MRGRVISLLLLVFLSDQLSAACSWTPRYSGQYRTTAFDVAIDSEGFVWIASGYGVQIMEPLANGGVGFVDGAAIPGSTRVITVNGTIGYAGSGSRVYILRRNGRTLEVIRSIDAGATVNDIAIASYLFVATSNGIAHFEVFDPLQPVRTNIVLPTTQPNVSSLAVLGTKLYATDGDATVDVFSLTIPALPQGTTPLESLPNSTAVHAGANNLVYVSDDLGLNTDIFSGTTRLARIGYGSNAFVQLTNDSFFAAGPQRIFRGLDVSNLARVAKIFEDQLLPFGGTNNRIYAMARSGNTLYVAGGDMGLSTYNIAGIIAPHPIISYAEGTKTSTIAIGDKAYFADNTSITELSINRSGISMTPLRSWAATSPVLHDSAATTLLASSNADLKLWSLEPQTPTATFTKTLQANVRSAVLTGNTAFALLADDTLWRVPLDASTPTRVTLDGGTIRSIARSGSAVAVAQMTNDGKMLVRYFAAGDPTAAPTRTATVDGINLGGLALNSTTAAIFTFKGINLIDLASGAVRVLAGSSQIIPQQLVFSGSDLLLLGENSRSLAVWDTTKDVLQRESSLPASPSDLHVSSTGIAVIASTTGSMAIDYKATLPKAVRTIDNHYYESAAASGEFLYLLENLGIDVFRTATGTAPQFITKVSALGTNGIAALPQTLFVLSPFGNVTSYSTSGTQLAQAIPAELVKTQPIAIFTAGDAVWVHYLAGCSTGTCERKTLVLDPKTLTVTATLNGGATKVVTSGTRAYALFQLPDEIRILNIANPLQPSQIIAAPSPALASDIGYSAGKVYVVAGKVYSYNESLIAAGEFLDNVIATQSLAIDGDCAVITGRHENPDFFTLPAWSAASSSITVPSPVRALALEPGRLVVLTDHSIEVWTTAPPAPPARRRSSR